MKYDLAFAVLHTRCLQRNEYVLKILSNYDIHTWKDLVSKSVPRKGLWKSEIKVLNDMREKMIRIMQAQTDSKMSLYNMLMKVTSKHEATRIFNLLINNGIPSVYILNTCELSQLKDDIYGIGPKSVKVLEKIVIDYRKLHSIKAASNQVLDYAAMPLV